MEAKIRKKYMVYKHNYKFVENDKDVTDDMPGLYGKTLQGEVKNNIGILTYNDCDHFKCDNKDHFVTRKVEVFNMDSPKRMAMYHGIISKNKTKEV